MLLNRRTLWGTKKFMEQPRMEDGRFSAQTDIHYREYLTSEVTWLLEQGGFRVEHVQYMSPGSAPQQSAIRRVFKHIPFSAAVSSTRLLGTTQYFLAQRRD